PSPEERNRITRRRADRRDRFAHRSSGPEESRDGARPAGRGVRGELRPRERARADGRGFPGNAAYARTARLRLDRARHVRVPENGWRAELSLPAILTSSTVSVCVSPASAE